MNKIKITLLRKYSQIAALKKLERKFQVIVSGTSKIEKTIATNVSKIKTVTIKMRDILKKESLFLIINES
ncbi:MAG: hypothetical protein U5J96_16610 [Ignavibacteriaceae bacterium]|nr:hypothetical protein [Ignavibacteriaceae bacterium]